VRKKEERERERERERGTRPWLLKATTPASPVNLAPSAVDSDSLPWSWFLGRCDKRWNEDERRMSTESVKVS